MPAQDWSLFLRPSPAGVSVVSPLDGVEEWISLPELDQRLAMALLGMVGRRYSAWTGLGADREGPGRCAVVTAYRELTMLTGESAYMVRRALDRLCFRGLVTVESYVWGRITIRVPAWGSLPTEKRSA